MEDAELIDWESGETHLLLNPRLPAADASRLQRLAAATPLPGHVWLATSGTSGSLKLVALSKDALLASAAAVNRRLEATAADVWLRVLPAFHVGGLGILARAHLSRARVLSAAWDPRLFAEVSSSERVTLTSLVPAQVSDLLDAGVQLPGSLRAIVVGGGALSARLYEAGRLRGWPLLPSYGLTECCSQVATATRDSRELLLLDHLEARTDEESRLALRGTSLLTGYATDESGFVDPKVEGWFISEDLGSVEGRVLTISGRRGDFVKIGGESVDLSRLQRILEELTTAQAAIVSLPDERLGHVIALAAASPEAAAVRDAFNERVLPFERIRRVITVDAIPRTSLGKIIRSRLQELVR